jgi:putative phosphoribosyl transferase
VTFIDRIEAGSRLAGLLQSLPHAEDVVVLGLPRGGVPVAAQVAASLQAPLDVLVVRKLGVPAQPELAFGAIGEHGVRVVNQALVNSARLTDEDVARVERHERDELDQRVVRYREGRNPIPLAGRTAVIVDDGVATGSTARAACLVAREQGASRVVLAVPVAPRGWTSRLGDVADELVSVDTPRDLYAVGQFYVDFEATSDDEVRDCLLRAAGPTITGAGPGPDRLFGDFAGFAETEVVVPAHGVQLSGQLIAPERAGGIVLFAHGSGSSRHSPRNQRVADALNHAGVATLLFDLLTEDEADDRANVFDTRLLAGRLRDATDWVQEWLPDLPIGYFGASTGAAAALLAAAEPHSPIQAVVSRGGRADLAGPALAAVTAPTLLIVGGRDEMVLDLNRRAQVTLGGESRLEVVPGATHLFEEPGTLEAVSDLAADWFTAHLRASAAAGGRR